MPPKIMLRVSSPKSDVAEDPKPTSGLGRAKVMLKVKKSDNTRGYDEVMNDVDTNLPLYEKDVKSFYNYYLNSPEYKNRLIKQGYKKPEDAIALRGANLSVIPSVKFMDANVVDTRYDPLDHKVKINPLTFMGRSKFNLPSVMAHEYSHVAGSVDPWSGASSKLPFPMVMSDKEANEIEKRNKSVIKNGSLPINLRTPEMGHDMAPQETKADMDTLRYLMHKDGVYDAGKQEFNTEHLKKAKERYSNDGAASRLFRLYSDKDLIYLMNNIAKNNNSQSSNA